MERGGGGEEAAEGGAGEVVDGGAGDEVPFARLVLLDELTEVLELLLCLSRVRTKAAGTYYITTVPSIA